MEQVEKSVETYWVKIYMAGSLEDAKRICRRYCYANGLCVTIEPTTYIYTGGAEDGVCVGLINYPRFPRIPEHILDTARYLAEELRVGLYQHSYCLVTPQETIWRTLREQ